MRKDGKRIRDVEPMYAIVPYIMKKRYDSMNMITVDIPIEPMRAYINKKRKEGRSVTHIGLIIAAYIRAMAEFPQLNRFIVNKKIYARNEVSVSMVVLRPGDDDGGTMSKIYFDVCDDIFAVQDQIDEYIGKNRYVEDGTGNSTDKMIKFLLSVPGLISFIVGLLKWMDKIGIMPKQIIDLSPFHASLLISNLASIRANHIFHHVYEFGTTSVAITMGNMREVPKRKKGEIEFERCLPLGVVMDERICSGSDYVRAFKKIEKYLADPTLLEGPPAVHNIEKVFGKEAKKK